MHEANIRKTAAYVFDNFCTETMRKRLVSKVDAEELKDLTKLMPAIQQLMHTVHNAEHPMKKAWGDLKKLLDCKQQPGETDLELHGSMESFHSTTRMRWQPFVVILP